MITRAIRVDAIRNAEGLAQEGLRYLDAAIALIVEEAYGGGGEDGDMEAALVALAHARVDIRQIRHELETFEEARSLAKQLEVQQ